MPHLEIEHFHAKRYIFLQKHSIAIKLYLGPFRTQQDLDRLILEHDLYISLRMKANIIYSFSLENHMGFYS